jgi:hypothetical protein
VLGVLGVLGATGGRATPISADRLVWSIEVLVGIVASEPLSNNPYLGQAHWYGDPVALLHRTPLDRPLDHPSTRCRRGQGPRNALRSSRAATMSDRTAGSSAAASERTQT